MKYIILIIITLILICSIICITINLTKLNAKCKKEKIIYRYIPKKILDQQYSENMATDLFKSIFTNQDLWVNNVMSYDERKSENINKYYISQI